MKITRAIAIVIILATPAFTALNAQTLRKAAPPAEFPPASYKGNQYVDSRGCIYIRAGIDGYVTWVPRVSRSRKQVCGYKPTAVAGATAAPPRTTGSPVIITTSPPPKAPAKPTASKRTATAPVPKVNARPAPAAVTAKAPTVATAPRAAPKPSPAPKATLFAGTKPAKPATKQVAATRPATTQSDAGSKPSPAPAATLFAGSKPAAPSPEPTPKARTARTAQPVAKAPSTSRKPSPAPAATLFAGGKPVAPIPKPTPKPAAVTPAAAPVAVQVVSCPNASALSQRYINTPESRFDVRCGPQTAPTVTYGRIIEKHSAVTAVPDDTRVVPRHVYDKRQNTTNVSVPSGYRPVWKDDRLNPHRAERTLRPAAVTGIVHVPSGYRLVDWDDNRLNLRRGQRTAQGEAQSNQIWSNTVPRTLVAVPTRGRIVTAPAQKRQITVTTGTTVTRLSTRSAPKATRRAAPSKGARVYVRVATYATEADARLTAQALARAGLPMRLGTIKSSGNKVVLAGPFASNAQAKAALGQVRGAGFKGARISK